MSPGDETQGKPGKPGKPGGHGIDGTGGVGGEGGAGQATGGPGGMGGTGGEAVGPRRRRRSDRWRLIAVASALLACLAILLSAWLYVRTVDARQTLCDNQHSVIEMQRLFLREHAAIRRNLDAAGVHADHADPDLLEKLRVLIDAGDCVDVEQ